MYIRRHLSFRVIYFYTWRLVLLSLFTGSLALLTYEYYDLKWVAIPWLPVSLIGVATAFFVGFKNNQSYERNWEARRVWGTITNLSRSFAAASKAFINNDLVAAPLPQQNTDGEVRALLYRHIGWLYTLKHAMHQRTTWEHMDRASQLQRKGLRTHDNPYQEQVAKYLSSGELAGLAQKKNAAVHLLDRQSQHLADLKRKGLIDDFRHMELQQMISAMYDEQGKSERIKNTPFPRQYATSSTIFILIFTVLLPFSMIKEFKNLGDGLIWLLVPFNLVVTWVFLLMEYTGDVSENPFEGLLNDVPLRTIVRNIEIDIKEMLGETDLPEKIQPRYGSIH